MRLASFNLESLGTGREGSAPLSSRIEALRPMIERLRADVLCLQEVDGQKVPGLTGRRLAALDALLAGTAYADYARHASGEARGQDVGDVHNLVTLSRLPVRSRRELRHDMVPGLDYRLLTREPPADRPEPLLFDRPVLITEVGLADGRSLHVVNVHLRAPLAASIAGQKAAPFVWRTTSGWAEGFFLSSLKRSAQALEVRLAVDRLIDQDDHALIAIAGDCNAEDHEVPLKILRAAEEDTGNGALAGRSLVNLARSLPADRRFSVLHHGRPQMLDHILVSRALLARVHAVEVHNEALSDELIAYDRIRQSPQSLHAPVVVELDLA